MFKRAALIFVAVAGCGGAVAADREQAIFVAACEKRIQDGLLAPSTYKRVKLLPVSKYSFTDDELRAEIKQRFDSKFVVEGAVEKHAKGEAFSVHEAIVDYDAQNAYGTPLRARSRCRYAWTAIGAGPIDEAFLQVEELPR